MCTNQRTEREERCESCPGLFVVLFFECCECGVNKGATIPPGTGWKVGVHLGSMDGIMVTTARDYGLVGSACRCSR